MKTLYKLKNTNVISHAVFLFSSKGKLTVIFMLFDDLEWGFKC